MTRTLDHFRAVRAPEDRRDQTWAVRTVRDGAVVIGGVTYRPQPVGRHKYDGKLEGLRLVFYRYRTGGKLESYISLWGDRMQFHELPGGVPFKDDPSFLWMFWDAEGRVRLNSA